MHRVAIPHVIRKVRGRIDKPGAIIRMAIDPTSKIIDKSDARSQRDAFLQHARQAYHAGKMTYNDFERVQKVVEDDGRFATLAGYDALLANGNYVILYNRTKATVQKDDFQRT